MESQYFMPYDWNKMLETIPDIQFLLVEVIECQQWAFFCYENRKAANIELKVSNESHKRRGKKTIHSIFFFFVAVDLPRSTSISLSNFYMQFHIFVYPQKDIILL